MVGNFGLFSFLRSWKLTRFLTTCASATSFKICTFSAFLYISETTRTIFFKSLHIIFIMYIIMSETLIKIDSLQHLEISRQTYPMHLSKIRATTFTFWRYANFYKLMRTIHTIRYNLLILKIFRNIKSERSRQPPKHNSWHFVLLN